MFKRTRNQLTLALTLTTALTEASIAQETTDKKLDGNNYFFGASWEDQGNNLLRLDPVVAEQIKQLDPVYPHTYKEGGLMRDSNGPVWVENLMNGDVNASLDPNKTSKNINFAISGSSASDIPAELAHLAGGQPTLREQREKFDKMLQNNELTVMNNDRFFFSFGTKDMLLMGFPIGDLSQEQKGAYVAESFATQLTDHIQHFINNGAKNIYVLDIPNTVRLGETIDASDPTRASYEQIDQYAIPAANEQLTQKINTLYTSAPNDTNIVTVKENQFIAYVQKNAENFGFKPAHEQCIDPMAQTVCSNDPAEMDNYIYYDGGHYSGKMHRIKAEYYRSVVDAAEGNALYDYGRLMDVGYSGANTVQNTLEDNLRARSGLSLGNGISLTAEYGQLKNDMLATTNSSNFKHSQTLLGAGISAAINENIDLGATFLRFKGDDAKAGRISFDSKQSFYSGFAKYSKNQLSAALMAYTGDLSFNGVERIANSFMTATSTAKGKAWGIGLAASYDIEMELEHLKLTPYAGGWISGVTRDAFSETGTVGVNVAVDKDKVTSKQVKAGFNVSTVALPLGNGVTLTPWAQLEYRHEFSNDMATVTATLIDNTARPVSVSDGERSKHEVDTKLGAQLLYNETISLTASYTKRLKGQRNNSSGFRLGVSAYF